MAEPPPATSISERVLRQRADGGIRGLAFGPNLASRDYLELFRSPEVWADLRAELSAFKVYGDNVHAPRPGGPDCGPNTYAALVAASVFRRLQEWKLPLHLEHAAVKEWESPTTKGKECLRDTVAALTRVREAKGDVTVVCMDEPLTSCVNADGESHPLKVGVEGVGDIARFTAEYAHAVRASGPAVALVEAYPHHPADRLESFLRHVAQDHGVPLSFFELDIDLNEIEDDGLSEDRIQEDLRRLRTACGELGIVFRAIVMSTHARTPREYRTQALALARFLLRRAAPLEGVTVQSWVAHDRTLPPNLPRTEPTSHLAVLEKVVSLGLYGPRSPLPRRRRR